MGVRVRQVHLKYPCEGAELWAAVSAARVLEEQSADHPNGDIVLVAFSGILEHRSFAHARENQVTYRKLHQPHIQHHESSCVIQRRLGWHVCGGVKG